MKINYALLLVLVLCSVSVNSMSLDGPVQTRYDPCGLGVIHFDKTLTEGLWMGVLNLGLYSNLTNAVIDLHFEKPLRLAWTSHNATLIIQDNSKNLLLTSVGSIPQKLLFYLVLNEDTAPPVIKDFILNNKTLCNDVEKASQTIESLDLDLEDGDEKYRHLCGRRSLEHTELNTIGAEADNGDWPWHVAIFISNADDPEKSVYQCGGNIISRTAVLTAGHCISRNGINTPPEEIVVLAGVTDLNNATAVGLQKFVAKEAFIHPAYNDIVATADLAIIIVEGFQFTEYVQPICIWGPVYDKTKLFGLYATVVGFGQTEIGTLSNRLRSTTTMVQSDATCIAHARKLYSSLLNEFTFCAGFGPRSNTNPRNGDSGGGLTLGVLQPDHKVSFFVRGVLSKCIIPSGASSCDPRFYVVYTDVGPHYTWIYHHAGLRYTSHIV